jgi:hypothetical protein
MDLDKNVITSPSSRTPQYELGEKCRMEGADDGIFQYVKFSEGSVPVKHGTTVLWDGKLLVKPPSEAMLAKFGDGVLPENKIAGTTMGLSRPGEHCWIRINA